MGPGLFVLIRRCSVGFSAWGGEAGAALIASSPLGAAGGREAEAWLLEQNPHGCHCVR